MIAHARSVRISPLKLNIVADLVRGKSVREALSLLQFVPKKGAPVLRKAIRSAQANAERVAKADPDTLLIDQIIVNKATVLKRSKNAGRGRIKPIRKPTAHLTVRLKTPTR